TDKDRDGRRDGRQDSRGTDRRSGQRPFSREERGGAFASRHDARPGSGKSRDGAGRPARERESSGLRGRAGDEALFAPGDGGERLPGVRLLGRRALLPRLDARTGRDISVLLAKALDAACPLKKAHRQDLPYNIVSLSRLLTVDRAEMRHPYWASPALTGAYVHYFLPWNVYRLARLFAGLGLTPPPDGRHLLLDLGSGPMTVPLALWLACPEWREKKIVVAACDCAGHPLQIGRAILENLAAQAGVEPWEVHLVQAPLEQGVRRAGQLVQKGAVPWLVTAANVLNELPQQKKPRYGDESESERDVPQDSRLGDILGSVAGLLRRAPEGARALFVEPGTRLGGLTLMGLRALAREEELRIEGPCPHGGLCPLYRGDAAPEDDFDDLDDLLDGDDGPDDGAGQERREEPRGSVSKLAGRAWCHFTFTSEGAPSWLRALAEPTGLAKETLSLAFLEVSAPHGAKGRVEEARGAEPGDGAGRQEVDAGRPGMPLRVISQPFPVPGRRGQCRYACSGCGLMLLEDAQDYPSGTGLVADLDEREVLAAPLDRRSGARCIAVRDREREGRSGTGRRDEGRGGAARGAERQSSGRAGDGRRDDRYPGRRPAGEERRPSRRTDSRGTRSR
ncbi:MAG: small ribosomal subunit Rsm22 family protein, partial [Desulfovibrionaceae bacterium]|nr:small ribosomal subunit Rsm22 family protein [Desulfovibrionaceae bacterium]